GVIAAWSKAITWGKRLNWRVGLVGAIFLAVTPVPSWSETKVVSGVYSYTFLVKNASDFPEISRESNTIEIIERRADGIVVRSTANLSAHQSRVAWPLPKAYSLEDALRAYLDT